MNCRRLGIKLAGRKELNNIRNLIYALIIGLILGAAIVLIRGYFITGRKKIVGEAVDNDGVNKTTIRSNKKNVDSEN